MSIRYQASTWINRNLLSIVQFEQPFKKMYWEMLSNNDHLLQDSLS